MGDQLQQHYRDNIQCLREEISKKEKDLNEKKEKLFTSTSVKGDTSKWDLDPALTHD